MKENLEITNDIKNNFNSHSKTYILREILIKKHKLKAKLIDSNFILISIVHGNFCWCRNRLNVGKTRHY